jgi:hypothetical protein
LFRKYVDARLNVYRQLPDVAAAFAAIPASIEIQEEIWRQAVSAAKASPGSNIILLPALNAMIDISNTQTMEAQLHTPIMIFVILFVVALISALLSGYGMAASQSTNWIYMICFAAIVAITVYVIIDIEYPRLGLVRIDSFDQALVDVLKSMK